MESPDVRGAAPITKQPVIGAGGLCGATGGYRDSTARLRRARKGVRMLTVYSVRCEAAEVIPRLLARANAAAC